MTHADVNDYDAGLLNDWGGGNVDWWQDYLRAEISRTNDYWRGALEAAEAKLAEANAHADRLADAAKRIRAIAHDGFRTADFHYSECSCPRCAEDALFDALAAHEARKGRM